MEQETEHRLTGLETRMGAVEDMSKDTAAGAKALLATVQIQAFQMKIIWNAWLGIIGTVATALVLYGLSRLLHVDLKSFGG